MKMIRFLCFSAFLTGILTSRALPSAETSSTSLPKMWQIVWADKANIQYFTELKNMGYDGLFKCHSLAPNYPGGEWRLVERIEGQYDWTSLQQCLDIALAVNMWFIPEIVINVPPQWFLDRYPDALLKDSRGITATQPDDNGAPYLLSPWFIASGQGDLEIQRYLNEFIRIVSDYPNVPAIMIGNFKLNVLPWKMGLTGEDFTYWPIFDAAAIQSYSARFGTSPIATWDQYNSMSNPNQAAFRDWLTGAIRHNIQNKYIPWTSAFHGYLVINASIWDNDGVKPSIFTTTTPEMTIAKQNAIKSAGATRIIINDDNMGDYGLVAFQQLDIEIAHNNDFLIYGERVPYKSDWARLFNMWAGFDPPSDGFINIEDPDVYWSSRFRTMYGPSSEPFIFKLYQPMVIRN